MGDQTPVRLPQTAHKASHLLDLEACSAMGLFHLGLLRERLGSRLVEDSLRVVVAEERSQWENSQKARHRMAELLREGLRRLDSKTRRGDLKKLRRDRPLSD